MSENHPDVADEPAVLVCPNGHTSWTATMAATGATSAASCTV